MRVFELAKSLKVSSKDLLTVLAKLRVKADSHMATLDAEAVSKVKAALAPTKKKAAARPVAKPAKPAAPTPAPKPVPAPPSAKPAAPAPVAKPAAPPPPRPTAPAPAPRPAVPAPAAKPAAPAPAPPPKPAPPAPTPAAVVATPPPALSAEGGSAATAVRPIGPKSGGGATQVAAPTEPLPPVQLKPLAIEVPLTVKELADKLSVSPGEVIKHLLGMKVIATINQLITAEPVEKILHRYGYRYQRLPTLEEKIQAEQEEEDPSKLVPRPPVVTLMGHVDHGKTSLLDAIRESRVVEGEAGGITQHIGAYRVNLPKGTITFLDTPGHEAFTAMRARGANVTDIVILVVAADDGVMPQTVEAIDHAKAAEATIVVALNKIDKPSANPDRVKKQLMELGLMSEEWGGKTVIVPVSAKTGEGMDQLLEMILLESELLELKANPEKTARGVVLEGKLSKGGGPVAHVLVQGGTLRVGDVLVSGTAWGRARALLDARGHRLKEAGPSAPIEVLGLNGVPGAGDIFFVVPEERRAREIAVTRQEQRKESRQPARRVMTLEEFHQQLEEGRVRSLNLILKADVQGSVEALRDAVSKIPTDKAGLKFLHAGVGSVTESDVLLAEASDAVVIDFNVGMTPEAEGLAKLEKVDVRPYRIIYEAVNDIRAALEGLLEPRRVEQVLGRAKVLQVFKVSKVGTVAGCQVVKGKVLRGSLGRLLRGGEMVHQGKITSLKRFKDDVREVGEGMQCGLSLADWGDYQPDDLIESVEVQEIAQKL